MNKICLLLTFYLLVFMSLRAQEHNLVYIENGGTRAGILTGVGGRIVFLSYQGSENLLKSDPELWYENTEEKPEAGPFAEWKAYNGHIVWNGPQSEWWIHQDVNPERKQNASVWPPDPWLIYGENEVLTLNENSIRMSSPASKVSGLILTKYIEISADGSLYFEVEAINSRQVPVAWDLWLNTRVDGYTMAYVKTGSEPDLKIKSGMNARSDTVNWNIESGYFYYLPETPPAGKQQRSSKAFIFPESRRIHAFIQNHYFSIEFPEVRAGDIHPEQAMVEIYNFTSNNREEALMELEFHAPYKVLGPGEIMKTWQKWRIRQYEGENNSAEHIKFLENNPID
jgi:hypothetical protein